MNDTEDEWLSVKEAANFCGVTRETLYHWKDKGPPFYRIVGRRRYRKSDLQQWFREQRSK